MAWKLTIDGTDRTTQVYRGDPVTFDAAVNERGQAQLTTRPGLVPALYDELVIYAQDGTTPLWCGVLVPGGRRGYPVASGSSSMRTEVSVAGCAAYLDWTYLTLAYTSPVTLLAVLQDIVAALPASHGITLDASQATGPTLDAFAWTGKRASDAIRELSDRTGYVSQMAPGKVLSMAVLGTNPDGTALSAPYTLSDAAWHCDEIEWRDAGHTPANTVTVWCGPSSTWMATQVWTQAGGATSWVTDIPADVDGPVVGSVDVGGVTKTVGPGAQYEWDAATSTLTLGTDTTPANGTAITLIYQVRGPFAVTATSGASPEIQHQVSRADILLYAQGLEVAEGLLDQMNQTPRELTIYTREHGFAPGQALSVDITARGITGDFTVTRVAATLHTDLRWRYTLTALESTVYAGSYLDRWRALTT